MSEHLRTAALDAATQALVSATNADTDDARADCALMAEIALNAADKTLAEISDPTGLETRICDLELDVQGYRLLIDAHIEVQVMHQRGFALRCSDVGRDMWARGNQTVPVENRFVRSAVWAVNEAFARPEVPSV